MERRTLLAAIGGVSAIGILGGVATLNSGTSSHDEPKAESESDPELEITDVSIPDGSDSEIQITVENTGSEPWILESIAVTGDRLHQTFDSEDNSLNAAFNHYSEDVPRTGSVTVPAEESESVGPELDVFGFDANGRTEDSFSSVDELEQELGGETIEVDVTLGARSESSQEETILHATVDLKLNENTELTGAHPNYPDYFSEPRVVDFEADSETNK